MSEFDFNSELDAILAQFNAGTESSADSAEKKAADDAAAAAERKRAAAAEQKKAAQAALEKQQLEEEQRQRKIAAEERRKKQAEEQERLRQEELKKQRIEELRKQRLEEERLQQEEAQKRAAARQKKAAAEEEPELDEEEDEDLEDSDDELDDEFEDEEEDYEYKPRKPKGFKRFLLGILGTVFAIISLFLLVWLGITVHPDTETASTTISSTKTNIVTRLDTYANNAKAAALGDLASYKKKYVIAEDALVAPQPNPDCYGSVPVSNASEILNIIQKARDSGLLGADEAVVFDPAAEFYDDGSNIRYYYDETILVIAWKELIEGRICSNVEIKIADASQFRRKLADDSYQTAVQYNCSQLANSANAVIAMNADFFAFRDYGITVYQRQVYRDNPNMVDTCYITASGDMIYSLKGELATMEEAQQFVDQNNVLFSMAFGPILVYDGVEQYCETYPMGEIDQEYSRAGIGQVDTLHYLYMTVNHAAEGGYPRCNVNEFAGFFASQGVKTAYNLDGGQTSEINIQGEMYNRVDWGNERPVSDIIYFATALSEEEG